MKVITDILERMPQHVWPDEADEFLLAVTEELVPGEFMCSRCSRVGPLTSLARQWHGQSICCDCVMA